MYLFFVLYVITSYPMCIRDSFPGGKSAGEWSWPLTSI